MRRYRKAPRAFESQSDVGSTIRAGGSRLPRATLCCRDYFDAVGGRDVHRVDFVTHYKDEIVAVGTFFLPVFAGGSIYIAWQQNKLTRTLERAYLAIKPLGIRPLKSDTGQLVGYIAIENVGHLPAKNVRWFISIKPANGSNENQFPIGKHAGDNFLPRGVETSRKTRLFGWLFLTSTHVVA